MFCFFYWTFADDLYQDGSGPSIYRCGIGALKRFKQLINHLNHLLMSLDFGPLLKECGAQTSQFLKDCCRILITRLGKCPEVAPKHITLFKTLYGMADEMLSVNFEDLKQEEDGAKDRNQN